MMQELLGGSHHGLVVGERKISINNGVLETKPPSLSSSSSHPSSSPTSAAAATTTTTTNSSNSENLRCPRCDSSNTKFCYYNNYNLTQPRHFCKTCRRYWTKGGALRNVPIGGGCRKSRNPTMSAATSMVKTSAGKMKTVASTDIGRSGLIGGPFDSEQFQSNPILWGSPQNSHILALLRSTQNPNPSPLSNVKEEVGLIENHMMNDSSAILNGRNLGLDPLNQGPSLGLRSSSFWRPQHQQQNGFILGEVQNNTISNGIQELYQRLRSSTTTTTTSSNNYNYNDNSAVVLTNQLGSTSSTVYDSASIASGHESSGYWINNSAFSTWSDLPTTTTGVYPLKN